MSGICLLNALLAIGLGIVGLGLLVLAGLGVTSFVLWAMNGEDDE